MKKLILGILVLISSAIIVIILSIDRNSYASSAFVYKVDTKTNEATITAYKGTDENVIIPNTIDGYNVTAIEIHAFDENRNDTNGKNIKSIIIEEGIKSIGDYAFIDCTNLQSVKLPESLENLGNFTFLNCSNLTKINIPSKLRCLGSFTFQETGFKTFEIPENIESFANCEFRSCENLEKVVVYNKDIEYIKYDLSGTEYDTSVFEYCSQKLVLYGYSGSTTEQYALKKGITFKNIEELILAGDINANSKVDATDLLLLKRHIIAGSKSEWKLTGSQFASGDFNSDETINATDLLLLKRAILENI